MAGFFFGTKTDFGNQKVTNVPLEAVRLAGWKVKVLLKKTSTFRLSIMS
jgi:hypothetical protein